MLLAAALGDHSVSALISKRYPDNSVILHAYRLSGGTQERSFRTSTTKTGSSSPTMPPTTGSPMWPSRVREDTDPYDHRGRAALGVYGSCSSNQFHHGS